MSATTKIAVGVASGYLLGRTKKLKLAIMIGSMLAGKKITTDPQALLAQAQMLIKNNPELQELQDQVKNNLFDAGKAAALGQMTNRLASVTDSLREQMDPTAGLLEDEATEDEEPEEEEPAAEAPEEEEEEPAAEAPEEEEEPAAEAPEEEEPEAEEPAAEAPEEAEAPARKRTVKKTASRASGAARKATGTAKKSTGTAKKATGTAKKSTGTAKKATGTAKKSAAKKTTRSSGSRGRNEG